MGALRVSNAFMARPLNMDMDRPAGQPIAFWLAVMTPSSFHLSKSISSPATEQTPSTMNSVSGETFWISSDTSGSVLNTPVEVSTWVMVTILYFFSLSAFSISGSWGLDPTGPFN